jgi:hypothetical protein
LFKTVFADADADADVVVDVVVVVVVVVVDIVDRCCLFYVVDVEMFFVV